MSEGESEIEKKVKELAELVCADPDDRKIIYEDLVTRIESYVKIMQRLTLEPKQDEEPKPPEVQETEAVVVKPKPNIELIENTDLVPVTKAELVKLTGNSEKLLTRYIDEDGILPYEILEMHAVACRYESTLPNVKNGAFDQEVPVDDMGVIYAAKENFCEQVSIKTLVDIYHKLDNDPEEFEQLMESIDENINLAYKPFIQGPIPTQGFIKYFVETYLDEGHRDLSLTVDIITSKRLANTHADAASMGYKLMIHD